MRASGDAMTYGSSTVGCPDPERLAQLGTETLGPPTGERLGVGAVEGDGRDAQAHGVRMAQVRYPGSFRDARAARVGVGD